MFKTKLKEFYEDLFPQNEISPRMEPFSRAYKSLSKKEKGLLLSLAGQLIIQKKKPDTVFSFIQQVQACNVSDPDRFLFCLYVYLEHAPANDVVRSNDWLAYVVETLRGEFFHELVKYLAPATLRTSNSDLLPSLVINPSFSEESFDVLFEANSSGYVRESLFNWWIVHQVYNLERLLTDDQLDKYLEMGKVHKFDDTYKDFLVDSYKRSHNLEEYPDSWVLDMM